MRPQGNAPKYGEPTVGFCFTTMFQHECRQIIPVCQLIISNQVHTNTTLEYYIPFIIIFLQYAPVVPFDHNQVQDTSTEMEMCTIGEGPAAVCMSIYVLVSCT